MGNIRCVLWVRQELHLDADGHNGRNATPLWQVIAAVAPFGQHAMTFPGQFKTAAEHRAVDFRQALLLDFEGHLNCVC